MFDVNEVMLMLDWNNDLETQEEGKETGIDKIDADILWEWTKELGFDTYKNKHPAKFDRYQQGKQLHMKIYGKHINIF